MDAVPDGWDVENRLNITREEQNGMRNVYTRIQNRREYRKTAPLLLSNDGVYRCLQEEK